MTTFTWSVQSMLAYPEKAGLSDVVFQVNWQCSAAESGYFANSFGTVPVTYSAGSSFTPYDQLTQEQVWGWINPSIDREEVETNLQRMLDEQKAPKAVTPALPWAAI